MMRETLDSPLFPPVKRLFLWLACALLTSGGAAAQAVFEPLLENGPQEQRINIVFVSEGYQSAELTNFSNDASRILDHMLSTSPYESYSTYFNAFAIAVASPESGADHPSRGQYRDTYFSAFYDCAGISRLICIGFDGHFRLEELLRQHIPSYDIVVLVVNDSEYGGSGGTFSVTSIHESAPEIAIHEIGHSFVHLTDEYGGGELGSWEATNATQETRRDHIRWRHWILPTTPLPTPPIYDYSDTVGLFEGAAYADFGWFRPQLMCKMRSLGVPFCTVCREHHIRAIYDLVSPIAGYFPTESRLTVRRGEDLRLSVEPMSPTRHMLQVQWFIDGSPVEGAVGLEFAVERANLPEDGVVVSVRVWDDTPYVADPAILLSGLLEESVAWEIIPGGDIEPAECRIDTIYPGPPVHLDIFVHDPETGVSTVEVLQSKNSIVEVEKGSGMFFTAGETASFTPANIEAFLINGIKIDETKPSSITLRITDEAGNQTTCDPIIATVSAEIPIDFELGENYPNPFNPTTAIPFQIAEESTVRLVIYDLLGREVAVLIDEALLAGRYEATWDGRNRAGRALPSGTYLYSIRAGQFTYTRPLVLMK